MAERAIRYYRGDEKARAGLRRFQDLETRWYASLSTDPDYSVYEDPYILSDLWACWAVYSRKTLLSISSKKSLNGRSIVDSMRDKRRYGTGVRSVVDLGNGFGYTTAALKELFPDAEVCGTNFPNCLQWRYASEVGNICGFEMLSDVREKKVFDLVFASEYFEHISAPIDHLKGIIANAIPRYFVIANAFGAKAIGHFDDYLVKDGLFYKYMTPAKTSRLFNQTLREAGYELVETNLWNNRPSFWRRKGRWPSSERREIQK